MRTEFLVVEEEQKKDGVTDEELEKKVEELTKDWNFTTWLVLK